MTTKNNFQKLQYLLDSYFALIFAGIFLILYTLYEGTWFSVYWIISSVLALILWIIYLIAHYKMRWE